MSDIIPDRLNEPPSVFNGCSWEELGLAASFMAALSLTIGIVLAILTGWWIGVIAIFTCGTLVGTFFISKLMASIKSGKPPGYYKTKLAIFKRRIGLSNSRILVRSETWDVGR